MVARYSYLFLLFTAAAFLFLHSCVEPAYLDPKERTVAVHCVLTNDTIQLVELRYSSYISESYYPKVTDADVKIVESYSIDTVYVDDKGDIVILDTAFTNTYNFIKVQDGLWQAEFTPFESAQYKLQAIVGKDTLAATTVYGQQVLGIDRINRLMVNMPMVRSFTHRVFYDKACTVWIYGQDYNPDTEKFEITSLIFTDHLYVDPFNVTKIRKKDVEEFLESKELPDVTPYDVWAYPLHLGIKDGAKDSELFCMHDKYLRIPLPALLIDEEGKHYAPVINPYGADSVGYRLDAANDAFNIISNFKPQYYNSAHKKAHYVFLEVSPEYDKYLLDLYFKDTGTFSDIDASDITHIWETKETYGNITGGRGIFAWANKYIYYYHGYKHE